MFALCGRARAGEICVDEEGLLRVYCLISCDYCEFICDYCLISCDYCPISCDYRWIFAWFPVSNAMFFLIVDSSMTFSWTRWWLCLCGWDYLFLWCGEWWWVVVSGGEWWWVVVSGGGWWWVVVSGGEWWMVNLGVLCGYTGCLLIVWC